MSQVRVKQYFTVSPKVQVSHLKLSDSAGKVPSHRFELGVRHPDPHVGGWDLQLTSSKRTPFTDVNLQAEVCRAFRIPNVGERFKGIL